MLLHLIKVNENETHRYYHFRNIKEIANCVNQAEIIIAMQMLARIRLWRCGNNMLGKPE